MEGIVCCLCDVVFGGLWDCFVVLLEFLIIFFEDFDKIDCGNRGCIVLRGDGKVFLLGYDGRLKFFGFEW